MFSSTWPGTFRPVLRLGKFEHVVDPKIRPGEQSMLATMWRPGITSWWLTGTTAVVIGLIGKLQMFQFNAHTRSWPRTWSTDWCTGPCGSAQSWSMYFEPAEWQSEKQEDCIMVLETSCYLPDILVVISSYNWLLPLSLSQDIKLQRYPFKFTGICHQCSRCTKTLITHPLIRYCRISCTDGISVQQVH